MTHSSTTSAANLPAPSDLARHWAHDPGTVFLNHGSFGGTPRTVLAAQSDYRARLEREPVDFFVNQHHPLMGTVREAIGNFVHAPAACIAPVPNATIGVATVLANLNIKNGDELLTNNHEYAACQNNLRRLARQHWADVVVADIPFPCPGPQAVIDALLAKVTPRTKAVLISHVTSPTGLIFPVEQLVPEFRRRGIITIIDGAHAPGMVPTLNLDTLQPDFYTANLHKWVCSPKGSALLYVAPQHREGFRPIILSNNAEKPRPGHAQFITEFDYIGTQDYTSLYAVPDAIKTMGALIPGGWPEVMRRNHTLCLRGRDLLCKALHIQPPAPDEMIGSICTMILPAHDTARLARLKARPTNYHDALQDALIERHRIQVPVMGLGGTDRFFRISAQLYNSVEQYEYLAAALKQELAREATL